MLLGINRIIGAPVMSLQTGYPLCRLTSPIINPYNLRIVAFYVDGPRLDFSPAVLFADDIREFGPLGAIVDSSDNVMSPDGMVRLNEVMSYSFMLNHILVIDEHNNKLGRVDNYTVDPTNFRIEQLHVKPGFFKSLATTGLLINRRQIVKVEPDRITVKSPTATERTKATNPLDQTRRVLNPEFDNPFRKHKPVTNQNSPSSPGQNWVYRSALLTSHYTTIVRHQR